MTKIDKYNKKILQYKNDDVFIIFYSEWCQYCQKTIELFDKKKLSYKAYDIDKIEGDIEVLLKYLKKWSSITQFNKTHKTRPIIFYKGKFVGGYDDLTKKLN